MRIFFRYLDPYCLLILKNLRKINIEEYIKYIADKLTSGTGLVEKGRKLLNSDAFNTLYYSYIYPDLCCCNQNDYGCWAKRSNGTHVSEFGIIEISWYQQILACYVYTLLSYFKEYWCVYQLIEAEWPIYALANIPPLVQIMACRLVGAKPLSEPMMECC